MKRRLQHKNIKAIERLSCLLRDPVLDSFGWVGISDTEPSESSTAESTVEPGSEGGEPGQELEGEGEETVQYVDPADVQGAVDEVISTLIQEHLIPEFSDPKRPPSLEDIFAVLFGESELKKQAAYFEELISGYADLAHIRDLWQAYELLKSMVEEMGNGQGDGQQKLFKG
jgi:hypothetical protein